VSVTVSMTAPVTGSVPDAVRVLLIRTAVEKAIPFEVRVPTAATRAAMKEFETGRPGRFASVVEFLADPNSAPPRKRPGDLTRSDVVGALQGTHGNKTHAAKVLSIAIGTLKKRMAKFGLLKPTPDRSLRKPQAAKRLSPKRR